MEELRVRINLQFFAGEKTEPATPKKRRDVRKKGQVFKSQDLVVAVSILVSFSILPKYLEIVRGYALSFLASSLSVSQIDQFTYHTVTDILFNILVIGFHTSYADRCRRRCPYQRVADRSPPFPALQPGEESIP